MNHRAELKKFAEDWKKYRRMQKKLVKIRLKAANPANIPEAKAVLANINHHIKTLDERVDLLVKELKLEPELQPKPAEKKTYIN